MTGEREDVDVFVRMQAEGTQTKENERNSEKQGVPKKVAQKE